MAGRILIIGACGQIGTELTLKLREIHGNDQVIASDIREGAQELMESGPFELLNATDEPHIREVIAKYEVKEVYLMAAMLSATGEKAPMKAWNLNMDSLFHILHLGKEGIIDKIFWPSSIAVFGPTTPKNDTPQITAMEPTTVYGISKQTGERWCEYFHRKFGVDVRSIRYPGIISYKTLPGGGTTDYAIEIFHEALKNSEYTSFLAKDAALPMMYMDDAIKATVDIMEAPAEKVKVRSSYNLSAISFTPEILAEEIKKHISDFKIYYDPDFRQSIAESWPSSIDDSAAREDWGWKHEFDLEKMTSTMLEGVEKTLKENAK
ncbi:NAD-dependent epimerase/dehydratase family protein [Christiangramia salexigens]|uniref:NAD-dependent epimerase n=1 Tax=Christiangramia salexigens TaxID=1913577 RepID=A0A1L3J786_9FLAO|nr:NAD-dependent epimerase/dehydratase family protein [Christiangramia salexigens]APG60963.1 NAD-dependent epimerase [Christiangramia salexigens]